MRHIVLILSAIMILLCLFIDNFRFHALGPIYYRSSNGAILVYDITDHDSFQKVKNWVKELKKMLGADIVLTIVGNKIDLIKDRNVPLEAAESYAESVGAKHFETSAKLNEGIEELFLYITDEMVKIHDVKQQTATLSRSNSTRRGNALIVEETDETEQRSSGKCCGGGGGGDSG